MYTMLTEAIKQPDIIFRYAIVGTLGALTNIAVIYVFTDLFNLWYVASAGIAAFAGYLVAFLLHKYWTFKNYNRDMFIKQAFSFLAVSVFNMFASVAILLFLVEYIGWWYMISQATAIIITSTASFLINRSITFR